MESGGATIVIGGTLRRAHIDRFVETAVEDYCIASYSGEGNAQAIHEEISAAHNEKRPIQMYGDDVPWGQFDSLEALCVELGLTFKRHTEGGAGLVDEVAFWEPGIESPRFFDSCDGNLVLAVYEIRKHRRDGTLDEVLDYFERIDKFGVPLTLEGSMADDVEQTEQAYIPEG